MARLSAGSRILTPGEAPADLGISERFRAQIRTSEEASRVIQNAINMFQTADSWLQEVNNILGRMGELATAAADSSKNAQDLASLDKEFQSLKAEVKRISEAGKYNGLQVNGQTAVAVYDTLDHKIRYTQPDGTDVRTLEINFQDGNTAENGINYAFESSAAGQNVGDYLFTKDGKSLLYIAQKSIGSLSARKSLMKLDLETNTITTLQLTSAGGAHASRQARLVMDDAGRVWVSDPSTTADSADKRFNVKLLDVEAMTLNAGGTSGWAGGVTLASSHSDFAVHGDYIYYIERSGGAGKLQYVRQSLNNTNDKNVLVYDLSSASYDFDAGETYAISADGQYLAFEDADGTTGTMAVVNTSSGQKATFSAGSRTNSIVAIDFDANNNLYWTDTGGSSDNNAVWKRSINFGDVPSFTAAEKVSVGNAGRFGAYNSALAGTNAMGLSVSGGSPANEYHFQVGPDGKMAVNFVGGDISLTSLGLSHLRVDSDDAGRAAIDAIHSAVDKVANQRAILGAQVSRLNFIHSANEGYRNNIASAESRLRDVDIAEETSKLTQAQILSQTGISILAQSNSAQQNVLRLLQ
jgi:flagellin